MEQTIEERTTDFLTHLRSATAISHQLLESLPLSKMLVDPDIDLKHYGLYLSLMQDVVANIEQKIHPLLKDTVTDLQERQKNYLILSDLKVLGLQKTTVVPLFDSEDITDPAFAMGILYVMEGSTLGGRFIMKNISENLGFDATSGARYFAGYGNKTGSLWKNFLFTLTAFERESDAGKAIVHGADYAFKTIEKHLSQIQA